jgi:hypothetical protein
MEKPKINAAVLNKRRSILVPPPVKAVESNARTNAARASIILQVAQGGQEGQRRLSVVPKPKEGLSNAVANAFVKDQREEEASLDSNKALMQSLASVTEGKAAQPAAADAKKDVFDGDNTKNSVIKDVQNPMHAFKLRDSGAAAQRKDGSEFLKRSSVILSIKGKGRSASLVPPPVKTDGSSTLKRMSLLQSLTGQSGRGSLVPGPPGSGLAVATKVRRQSLMQDYRKEQQQEETSLSQNTEMLKLMHAAIAEESTAASAPETAAAAAAAAVAAAAAPEEKHEEQMKSLQVEIQKPLRRLSLNPVSTQKGKSIRRASLLQSIKKPASLVPLPPTSE